MTRTTTDATALVQGLYEAFGRGDVPAVLAMMSDDVEWYEAEGNPWYPGHAFVGPQQVLEHVFAKVAESYEGFTVVVDRFLVAGDTVVMQGREQATVVHATGRSMDVAVAHVWDVRDGRIVRFQQYADTRQFAEVLGAST